MMNSLLALTYCYSGCFIQNPHEEWLEVSPTEIELDALFWNLFDFQYILYTIAVNRHNSVNAVDGAHCQCYFVLKYRLLKEMKSTWGSTLKFQYVILDYFNSPVKKYYIKFDLRY